MRLLPKSLLGQVTLAVALTLFLLQGVNAVLGYNIEKDRAETALVNTLGLRLVAAARFDEADGFRPRRAQRPAMSDLRRQPSFQTLDSDRPLPAVERRLAETLRANGRDFTQIRVVERPVAADPVAARFLRRMALRRGLQEDDTPRTIAIAGISDGGEWDVVRAPIRAPHREFGPGRALLRAAALALVLSLVLWLVLRRITGPLAQLTSRTERFSQDPGRLDPIEPRGPEDVRRLIAAHNAMEARIGAMLDEKDVMLGAIGHDLKTPLAALRVRVESVADETARERMAETIEDIAQTLDDILALARVGRAHGSAERTDLAALVASVVEEFEDMDEAVSAERLDRLVAPVRVTWLKRGLRNLVTNALRYAGAARVSVLQDGGDIVLRVDDDGPGIPPDRIADMLEPFARGEASRNRATGGAGLGLTLARAVAEQHGGSLGLANRAEGGLRAEIRLPA